MTIQPLGERVLLEPAKKEEKTKGGLYIPEEAKKEKKEGIVLAAGTFKDGKDLPLKKGDHVIYGGYSSEEIEVDGKKYLLVDYKDVIAKIER
ncbi:co-chaperone GroES [Candidatus Woesearchaeota archaeon]|nr:co-chaperone GroES [Candidatus Woesearchaeota archaeon]